MRTQRGPVRPSYVSMRFGYVPRLSNYVTKVFQGLCDKSRRYWFLSVTFLMTYYNIYDK